MVGGRIYLMPYDGPLTLIQNLIINIREHSKKERKMVKIILKILILRKKSFNIRWFRTNWKRHCKCDN